MLRDEFIAAILAGEFDDQEQRIYDAFKQRRRVLAATTMASIGPGDTVVIQNTRPKYLNGLRATVVNVNQTTASVRFVDPLGAKRYGHGIVRVPASCLTPVEEGDG